MSTDDERDEPDGETDAESGADGAQQRPSRRRRRPRPAAEAALPPAEEEDDDDDDDDEDDDGDEEAAPGGDDGRRDLPKWNRARVKRKQPKGEEQDAFQATVRKAGKGLLQRAPVVIGGLVAVAGIVAGVLLWQRSAAESRAQATRSLASTLALAARSEVREDADELKAKTELPYPIPLFKTEDERVQALDKAIAELQDGAPNDATRTLAGLVRAARLVEQGNFDDAQAAYRQFLSDNSAHPLRFLAQEGLVIALEGSGQSLRGDRTSAEAGR